MRAINIDRNYLLNKSPVFCMAPWIYLHIMPGGQVLPCCMPGLKHSFGNATQQSLQEIWNNEKFRTLRINMLSGKKSSVCQKCYAFEGSSINNMRSNINNDFGSDFSLVEKTKKDGTLDTCNIKYFDVRFSNICNFKCRSCSSAFSTSWYDDHEKLYGNPLDEEKFVNATAKGTNRLWQELVKIIPTVKTISFTGGEPMLTEEHYMTLNILLQYGRQDCLIKYNTNLSTIHYRNYNLIELWNQFQRVYVSVSMDDIGKRAEYFRKGLNWERFINNFDTLKKESPHVHFSMTITVNIINVFYLPELVSWFCKNHYINIDKIIFIILLDPCEYSVQVLPHQLKNKVTKKLNDSLKDMENFISDKYALQRYQKKISNIITFMYEQDTSHLLETFIQRTLRLDEIRKEKFSTTYPELSSLLKDYDVFNNAQRKNLEKLRIKRHLAY